MNLNQSAFVMITENIRRQEYTICYSKLDENLTSKFYCVHQSGSTPPGPQAESSLPASRIHCLVLDVLDPPRDGVVERHCQRRRETGPKGGAKYCHHGCAAEAVWRGGIRCGASARRSVCGGVLARAAVAEAITLGVHFQDMDVMGEAVEQCPVRRSEPNVSVHSSNGRFEVMRTAARS